MNKLEFLSALRKSLSGLPKQDVEERPEFYSEMIDDRIEEGCEEEDAVSRIGDVDEISKQIISDIPLSRIAKERVKPKRRITTWEIVLIVLGSPIWLTLAIAALAVVLAIYVVLWSLIVSVWSVFASLSACSLGGIVSGVFFALGNNVLTGIAIIGTGMVCAGLSIFLFFGCKASTKGIIYLTEMIALGIKKCFMRKENA